MRKIIYLALVLFLIFVSVSCNVSGKDDERFVSYVSNGGKGTMPDQLFMVGIAQKLASNAFIRDGYRFTGWNTRMDGTGTAYSNTQILTFDGVDSDITLFAQWLPADTYTIRFVNTLDSSFSAEQVVRKDATVNLYDLDELGIEERYERYYLDLDTVWCTSKNGVGTFYADGAAVTNLGQPGDTVKLYTQWKGVIIYDENGGEYEEHVPDQEMALNNRITLRSNRKNDNTEYYHYDGAVFIGWSTLPSNQIDGTFYHANEVVKNGFSANTTLYAYWQFNNTAFTVDKKSVIQHRMQNTVTDPEELDGCEYIILSSGLLFSDEGLHKPVSKKYGYGEFSYVTTGYQVKPLKDEGSGDTYYKDSPEVKVIVLYTIPSGGWKSSLPSKRFMQLLGNASGTLDNRVDQLLYINLSHNPSAVSWSGSCDGASNGWMLQLSEKEDCWQSESRTESATRYQTAYF